jgi:DNA (cytosine-5)-methyltransferase 1
MGSLFAGIGGFDLGFERAGFKTVWQVEKNAYCRRVLRRHFPDADRRVTDVRFAGARNLLPVDVICGGFPCQDISNAGLRAGIDGERSGLWREMHRIISELRPRFVIVENVAALLGRGMGRVLGDLSEIGYDAEWQVISAADVGAPHLRERIWIVAYPRHGDVAEQPWAARREGWQWEPERTQPRSDGEAMAHANAERRNGWARVCRPERRPESANSGASIFNATHDTQDSDGVRRSDAAGQWRIEPAVGRVAHGVPARVDRLRALGNAVVPQIPELIARRLLTALK